MRSFRGGRGRVEAGLIFGRLRHSLSKAKERTPAAEAEVYWWTLWHDCTCALPGLVVEGIFRRVLSKNRHEGGGFRHPVGPHAKKKAVRI